VHASLKYPNMHMDVPLTCTRSAIVAELKQLVSRPDVVEAHDVTAADPRLLVYLKAYKNTVPVPRHWCHKRKYLQVNAQLDSLLPPSNTYTGKTRH
jgi:hypothetical protein